MNTGCLIGFLLLLAISIFHKPVAYAGGSDSIVNERIPVRAEQLESHWNVDCTLTLSETLIYLQNENHQPETEQKLAEDLKKCRYIYNVPGSAHYKSEPDYELLEEKLSNLHD